MGNVSKRQQPEQRAERRMRASADTLNIWTNQMRHESQDSGN